MNEAPPQVPVASEMLAVGPLLNIRVNIRAGGGAAQVCALVSEDRSQAFAGHRRCRRNALFKGFLAIAGTHSRAPLTRGEVLVTAEFLEDELHVFYM
jgi:hypothetical protein